MSKFLAALVAACAVLCGLPAAASTFITFAGPSADGSLTWDFGNGGGIAAGAFTDVFNFIIPLDGTSAGSVQATFTSPQNDLTFSAVDFNGNPFTLYNLPSLNAGYLAETIIPAGLRALTVHGISPGIAASYSGHLSYTPVRGGPVDEPPGVPEPTTWALMIIGFGGVGAMLRTRRSPRFV
jgi:hypothetical protein